MGNPLMDRLKKRTGKNKGKAASKSAKDVEAQEAKTPASPAEDAEETAALTPTAKSTAKGGKKLTALERMKAGKNKDKSGKKTKGAQSAPTETPPAPTATGVNPPKNKRKTKAKASGAKAADKGGASTSPSVPVPASLGNTLYIGCYPVQGVTTPTSLHVLLEDVKAAVCKANGVTHWDFLEFGKGSAALAQALDAKLTEEPAPVVLYAEPFSSESRAVEQILLKHYDIVVRGIR